MISKNQIKFVRQLEQKKFRKAENLFIAETHKVVGDLLAAGFRPKHIFATNEWVSEHRSMLSTIGCPITASPSLMPILHHPSAIRHHPCLSFLTTSKTQAISAPSSVLPIGLASIPSTARLALSTHGTPRLFRPPWAA